MDILYFNEEIHKVLFNLKCIKNGDWHNDRKCRYIHIDKEYPVIYNKANGDIIILDKNYSMNSSLTVGVIENDKIGNYSDSDLEKIVMSNGKNILNNMLCYDIDFEVIKCSYEVDLL